MHATIEAGQHATIVYPQDMYPAVVSRVSKTGKTAWISRIKEVSTETGHKPHHHNGPFPVWHHVYTQAEIAEMSMGVEHVRISLRKDGKWRVAGYENSALVRIGEAVYHRDFSW